MDTKNPTWTFLQTFTPQFQALGSELEGKLEAAKSTPTPVLLQELSVLLAKATKILADATGSIPTYDQKQYEIQLKGFEKSIETLRASSAPKSKFAFKRKAGATPIASKPVPESPATPAPESSSSTPNPSNLVLSSHLNKYLTRSDLPDHPPQTDLSICDLEGCIVNLLVPLDQPTVDDHIKISALHARNLKNCVLLLPDVEGSALLHDMVNCVIVLGCHQFRMHSSKNIDVLLSISSTPIIEDCSSIRFGYYPTSFHLSPPESPAPLSVQDFSHIRPTPSPNFSLFTEADQDTLHATLEMLRDPSGSVERLQKALPVSS
ncbi:hypothetical protein BDN70DRAFT_863858 [Pholiota conissans]|uniref:C-CAP/cofactor C-like domain-containing protein n=1 Tax=Pholiota conissans TaxID=109636 RepID=A0A9P5YVS9_9AGAR|nr:hypothetical protein BDN70DRAFT_863858 [Pholiota conissans]